MRGAMERSLARREEGSTINRLEDGALGVVEDSAATDDWRFVGVFPEIESEIIIVLGTTK